MLETSDLLQTSIKLGVFDKKIVCFVILQIELPQAGTIGLINKCIY